MSHSSENIAEKISVVVEEFGLIDKIFAVTLDNASANSKAYDILQPVLFGYLGSYPAPTHDDPHKVKYLLVTWVLILHLILWILVTVSTVLYINVVLVISLISL